LITQEGVSTPGPLGLRHWEISTSGYYFWEGSGLYTKLENDHSHVTILNILPK
jgi:hypothetical protein